jgi:hypothetical protein
MIMIISNSELDLGAHSHAEGRKLVPRGSDLEFDMIRCDTIIGRYLLHDSESES